MRTVLSILRHLVRAVIAILALVNLAAVLLFQYNIPDTVTSRIPLFQNKTVQKILGKASLADQEEDADLLQTRIVVPTQSLNYNGEGKLDLLSGVYVMTPDGSKMDDVEITTQITPGETKTDKIVNYYAVLDDGTELTASRRMGIGNRYTGPSIVVSAELPEMDYEDGAPALLRTLKKNNAIAADDGFGNDITGKINASLGTAGEDDDEVPLTLKVGNELGDAFSTQVLVPVSTTGVVMKLTTKETTIHVGDGFSFYDYIKDCHDAEGNDLHYNIIVKGSVDNWTAGDYTLEIYCMDANKVTSPVKKLLVHVVE